MLRYFAVAISLLLTAALAADDASLDIVERAFKALDSDYREAWAFTETTKSEDGVRVARYDPRAVFGERWTLVSVDDRVPTDSERRKFREDRRAKDEDDGGARRGMTGVRADTLKLVQETEDFWLFTFVAADDDDDDFMQYLDGELRIAKRGHYVEHMRLENRGTIRPAFGVKISRFATDLRFAPVVDGGPIVPHSVDVEVRGRAYLAVGFDEVEAIRYDDFEYVGTVR